MDEGPIRAAIQHQRILLTAVADGTRGHTEANAEYLRHHAQLVRLTERKAECFCPWGNVIAWSNLAATLGDPAWREYLANAVARFEAATVSAPRPPQYPTIAYQRFGDPNNRPFMTAFARLEPAKQVALRAAIKNQLEVLGPNVADNKQVGEWINSGGVRVLEFKVSIDAAELPPVNPDGTPRSSGYPKQKILLRVGCCQAAEGPNIILLDCFDKGKDVNGQESAIETWVTYLKDFRQQEARAKKNARRGR